MGKQRSEPVALGVEERKAGLFPAFDPIFQGLSILKPKFPVLACHTGSAVFILSVAIEYYLLVPGKLSSLCLQGRKRNCPLKMITGEFCIICIGTDQQGLAGQYLLPGLFR
jgi:hypothetical protein